MAGFCLQPYFGVCYNRKMLYLYDEIKNVVSSIRCQTDIWAKPVSIPFDERKCHIHACDGIEDEFHSLFECLLYAYLKKQYACIERYFVVSPSMYTLIHLF